MIGNGVQAEVAPGSGPKETLEAVRAAMQQDTPGPDPMRQGGPDEDLAASGEDAAAAAEDAELAGGGLVPEGPLGRAADEAAVARPADETGDPDILLLSL